MKEKLKNLFEELKLLFIAPKYNSKVFCIGYNKTGTTTVGMSFKLLGYRNSSFNKKVWREYYHQGQVDKILKYTAKFDSFDDLPWLNEDMIPILDEKFPGSKFVYLEREEEAWKKSYKNWTYKMTGNYPDVEQGYQAYLNHQDFVLNYFKNKPKSDFITLRVNDKEGFKKLATFLGKNSIQDEFPHFNKT